MTKNECESGVKIKKIDYVTDLKLLQLRHVFETQTEIIKKLADHAHVCDKWWLDRDNEENYDD